MFEHLPVVLCPLLPCVVAGGREREHHAERVLDLNTGIDSDDCGKTFPDEARANEQHEGERDLSNDERAAKPHRLQTGRAFASVAQ